MRERRQRAWLRLKANADLNGARSQLGRVLGEGTFGLVRAARLSAVVKRSKAGGEPELAVEEDMLARVRDAGRQQGVYTACVGLIAGCGAGAPGGFLILERCRCTLEHAVSPSLALSVRRQWARELLQGLQLLETLTITHQDLKPANVLIGYDGRLKIADFGIAKRAGAATGGGWTVWWRPPEVVLRCGIARVADTAEDRWAAALVIHQLACGRMPLRPGGLHQECAVHALARGLLWSEETLEDYSHLAALAPPGFVPRVSAALTATLIQSAYSPLRISDVGDPLLKRLVRMLGRLDPQKRAGPADALTILM